MRSSSAATGIAVGVTVGFGAWSVGCSLDYDAFKVEDKPFGSGGSGATGAGNPGGGGESSGGAGGVGGLGGAMSIGCNAQYGDLPGYERCARTPTQCTFYFDMNQNLSCDEACGQRGGECLSMHNNDSGQCGLGSQESCAAEDYNDAICVCSHGCGEGIPCESPQTCSGGTCN